MYLMQTDSLGDNLHKMFDCIFWKKIRKIPICHLLNLPIAAMVSVNA